MKKRKIQYTIRDIPERLDKRLRERCVEYGGSLNKIVVEALAKGIGIDAEPKVYHDLDHLAGTWVKDPGFDAAMKAMKRVDREMWR
jgi:hypothetical protein